MVTPAGFEPWTSLPIRLMYTPNRKIKRIAQIVGLILFPYPPKRHQKARNKPYEPLGSHFLRLGESQERGRGHRLGVSRIGETKPISGWFPWVPQTCASALPDVDPVLGRFRFGEGSGPPGTGPGEGRNRSVRVCGAGGVRG